jgi:hypothetical protein
MNESYLFRIGRVPDENILQRGTAHEKVIEYDGRRTHGMIEISMTEVKAFDIKN